MGVRLLHLFVYVSVCFPHDISETDAARITQTWRKTVPRWFPKNHLFWGQKFKGHGQESEKHCGRGSLHSCECWRFSSRTTAISPPLKLLAATEISQSRNHVVDSVDQASLVLVLTAVTTDDVTGTGQRAPAVAANATRALTGDTDSNQPTCLFIAATSEVTCISTPLCSRYSISDAEQEDHGLKDQSTSR